MPPTQDLPSHTLCEVTARPATPPCSEYDGLVSQVSLISISLEKETVERKSDVQEIPATLGRMETRMEMFSKDAHISEEQQSRIASLELENRQLHDEVARLRLSAQFTTSLPSFSIPVHSSTPKVHISSDDIDESSPPHERWIRGTTMRSLSTLKPPKRLW